MDFIGLCFAISLALTISAQVYSMRKLIAKDFYDSSICYRAWLYVVALIPIIGGFVAMVGWQDFYYRQN